MPLSLIGGGSSWSVPAEDPPPDPGDLSVEFKLTSAAGGTSLPFTFGHVFAQGDVPTGNVALATATGLTAWQCTPTTYWPDGSVRHAIIAGLLTCTADVEKTLTLTSGADPGGTDLTTTDLQAAIPASTTIAVGGTTMTLASTFLASPHRTVCEGPVMSNWIYRLAVSGSNHLVIWADVRLYSDDTVEIFPWVENAYLNVASPASTSSTSCAVTVGGDSKFSQSINIAHHSRVPLLTQGAATNAFSYWSGTDPLFAPKHDTAYLRASKMVPNYGFTSPSSTALNGLQEEYTPNTRAGVSSSMGSAGGSGALLGWYGLPAQALYCTSGDVRAYRAAVTFGLSGGAWGTHFRDEATNEPIRFDQHATAQFDSLPAGSGTENGTAATSHEPSFAYLPWLITGRWWFLDEQLFWASWNYLKSPVNARRGWTEYETAPYLNATGASGVIDPRSGAYTTRGAAWSLRTLVQALVSLPTTHPCFGSFKAALEANTDFYRATFVDGTHADGDWVHPLGVIGEYGPGTTQYSGGDIAPGATGWWNAGWMQGMIQQAWGHVIELSPPQSTQSAEDAAAVVAHACKFATGLAGDGGAGNWNWRRFTVYAFPLGTDGSSALPQTWVTSWGDAIAAYEGGSGGLGAISATAGLSLKRHNSNTDWSSGNTELTFGSLQYAALSYAVDNGVTGASAGRGRITGSSSHSAWATAFDEDPSYGIVPRA